MSEHASYESAYGYCEQTLREQARSTWFACMFAPQAQRRHLHALYAFAHEVERISAIVSEPALGEIRLQWWREALQGERAGEANANPVAQALLQTIGDCKLPASALLALLEARRFDLYADPMPTLNDLEGYCGETVSILFRLASIILCAGAEPGGADACGHAGVALGITEKLASLPQHAARGRCYVPGDVLLRHGALPQAVGAGVVSDPLLAALAEMRSIARDHLNTALALLPDMDIRARPAFVQLSQVAPLLRRMETRNYDPFADVIALPQWRMQWAMWRF